jgi:hypothetical protein
MLGVLAGMWLIACTSLVAGDRPRVLFDESHSQRFFVDRAGQLDLSTLAEVLRDDGLRVDAVREPLTAESLSSADGLVISGPFAPLPPAEVDAIASWLERGGVLVTMLHIPGPLTGLLHRLGIVHSNGVIRERENVLEAEPLNFTVKTVNRHPLTEGLTTFSIYGSWALLNENERAIVIAESGSTSWVDLDGDGALGPGDAVQPFAVAVAGKIGRGRFVVFGDDAMFQNRFITGSNERLARNLARWIKGPTSRLAASENPARLAGEGTGR